MEYCRSTNEERFCVVQVVVHNMHNVFDLYSEGKGRRLC